MTTTRREELKQEIDVLRCWARGEHADRTQSVYERVRARYGSMGFDTPEKARPALERARAELAALESAQPKTATVEERFPVGSRWRSNGFRSLVYEVIAREEYTRRCPAPPHERQWVAWRRADGSLGWDPEDAALRSYTRLDDHPAPPPVAQPAAPVPMVGDVWRGNGGCDDWPTYGAFTLESIPSQEVYFFGDRTVHGLATLREVATFVRRAQPQPDAPAKPAPMCEAPGWLGAPHALDADEYGVCRVCKCTASDRRAARRRAFDAKASVEYVVLHMDDTQIDCGEYVWRADHEHDTRNGLTPQMALDALWQELEAKRVGP